VFFSSSFIGQFEGFLTTLGVPISAWCGVILADLLLRRRGYDAHDLFRPRGRYGDIRVLPLVTTLAGTVLGWGLVTNSTAGWLNWQGYLLDPFGLGGKSGSWAYANLGVLAALAFGFVITLALSRGRIREQEKQPASTPTAAQDEAVLPA
jgi:NCS1 family nucleobase:cation symporter-1